MRFLVSLGLAILMIAAHVAPTHARGGGRGGGGGLVSVRGHYRANGAYVAPYVRTSPDGIIENNRSYRGATYRTPSAPVIAAAPLAGPIIGSEGPRFIPGPTTWTDTEERSPEPWCASKRVIGTGSGFCMIN